MTAVAILGFVAAAALGTLLRWQVGRVMNTTIPWGTLTVNVIGSFVVGLLLGLDETAAAVIVTGGLGSLTTMSTFAFEVHELGRRREVVQAGGYLVATVVLGVVAARIGLELAR